MRRPEPVGIEQRVEFRQVDVHHEQRIAEVVAHRMKAPVADLALVDATVHAQATALVPAMIRGPAAGMSMAMPVMRVKASHIAIALRTPSSWKP